MARRCSCPRASSSSRASRPSPRGLTISGLGIDRTFVDGELEAQGTSLLSLTVEDLTLTGQDVFDAKGVLTLTLRRVRAAGYNSGGRLVVPGRAPTCTWRSSARTACSTGIVGSRGPREAPNGMGRRSAFRAARSCSASRDARSWATPRRLDVGERDDPLPTPARSGGTPPRACRAQCTSSACSRTTATTRAADVSRDPSHDPSSAPCHVRDAGCLSEPDGVAVAPRAEGVRHMARAMCV